jgi:NADP-dependent 3-hydroxy acid dehydrogenase YdfG
VKDQVIVITGASTGIGLALAEIAVARGARVVVAARRTAELEAAAKRLGATAVTTDVTQRDQVDRLRDQAIAKHGHIDVWVANAGRGISRSVLQLTDQDIDDMIATNVKSVVYGMQAVVPHFRDRKRGHHITVSSMLARIPFATVRSAYSAAKAAVTSLSTSLRMEITEPEIHISTVFPGVVATEFGSNALHGGFDSRKLPNAQSVEEAAGVIADLIERPCAEVYTRPELREMTARYYSAQDVGIAEQQFRR